MEDTKLNANLKFKDKENDTDLCTFKELYELVKKTSNYLKITECGKVRGNQMTKYTLASETYSYYNLTFKNKYETPPMVIVCLWNGEKISYGNERVAVSKITTTGCELILSAYVNVSNYGINYMVISND